MNAQQDLTRPLQAYWVGDMKICAAEYAEQALAVANEFSRPLIPYTIDDVDLVGTQIFAEKLVGPSRPMVCASRGLLQAQHEPDYE